MYYDVIDAVMEVEEKYDINDIQLRISTIQELYHSDLFSKIINSSNRVINLSKNSKEIEIDVSLFKKQEEIILWKEYEKCNAEKPLKYIINYKTTIFYITFLYIHACM